MKAIPRSIAVTFLLSLGLACLSGRPCLGQVATGSIVGQVTDTSGELIPGVMVTAIGAGDVRRVALTDATGSFRFVGLPPGSYELLAELDAFASATHFTTVLMGASASLTIELGTSPGSEQIVVTSESPIDEGRQRPGWNFWLETKGGADGAPLPRLEVGRLYHVSLDLSRFRYDQLGIPGAASRATARSLEDELSRAFYEHRRLVLTARVRPVLVGRALRIPAGGPAAESWRSGRWVPAEKAEVPMEVRLGNLFAPELASRGPGEAFRAFSERTRAGGVRFAVKAERKGCAQVTFSIWGEDGSLPLDHLAFPVAVGDADCGPAEDGRELTSGLLTLLADVPGVKPDAALHLFEVEAGRKPHTVAVLVAGDEAGETSCDGYAWQIPGSVSRFFFEQRGFRNALKDAWEDDQKDGYGLLARQLVRLLFPPARGEPCGAAAALEALRSLGKQAGHSLFVRLVDSAGTNLFLPLGLLFYPENEVRPRESSSGFAVHLLQPLPLETYGESPGCIGAWSFVLPVKLRGEIEPIELPASLSDDTGVQRSIEDLREVMDSWRSADETPAEGVVLLAHHVDGSLSFDDPKDPWLWTEVGEGFPRGSAILLSTCSAGDLSRSWELVDALNEARFDAVMLSPFEVYTPFGITLAVKFSELVAESRMGPDAPRVIDLFHRALDHAAAELEPDLGPRAHGMAREFLFAGNPSLRLCIDRQSPE